MVLVTKKRIFSEAKIKKIDNKKTEGIKNENYELTKATYRNN